MLRNQKFLSIILNKSSFCIDEPIEGKIELNIISPTVISDISLSVFFLENWLKISPVQEGDTFRDNLLTFNLNINKLLNINTDLVSLAPGKYRFPFSFKIPKALSTSFEFSTPEKKAYIRYTIDAKIISPYIQGQTSNYIFINSKYKEKNVNNKPIKTSTISIYKWNIVPEGTTTLKVSLLNDENYFQFGKAINFKVDIDNSIGKLITKEIKVVIIRKIDFKKNISREIVDSITNDCVVKKFKTLLKPGEKESYIFEISLKDMDSNMFNDLKKANLPYTNLKELGFFLPNIQSAIIDCNYTFRATLYFDSFVAYKHRPRVFIPINICHLGRNDNQPDLNPLKGNNIDYTNNNNYQNIIKH